MPKQGKKKVLAVVDDLFFTVKISDAAKRAGLDVEYVKSDEDVMEKAKENPTLIIFDLNFNGIEPLKLISALKAAEQSKPISLIAYLSHVQGELKQKAHEAGCDMVLARSAFSQNLIQIMKRHATTL
jgi:CheY-like chemotaxis protein